MCAINLIADTNVWYDIGLGGRDPATLKSGGNRLITTPTSFLELASRIDERTFPERKAAAQAVVSHADEIAEDCESHLAKLWGLQVPGPAMEWIEGFRAIAQASSPADLGGVGFSGSGEETAQESPPAGRVTDETDCFRLARYSSAISNSTSGIRLRAGG